ncbi:TPA: hypothetical protein ACX3CW_002261 [Vibrio parahaemolyticus]|uniref:hypothetical protein n=1 Tax=Vibrio parahaemolyticus TaxID=670 RepID=UPI003B66C099|nr:hypothetical protein [Vibrio parahaemolyticus]HCE3427215.1 hypothetical protein [Vibrio parahaemolyticus]HCG9212703.1 hypothetical protein [Vibrio parahaemolyticus]HCM1217664.1 hypothetical protein [Vibrio parahaemolyticus]
MEEILGFLKDNFSSGIGVALISFGIALISKIMSALQYSKLNKDVKHKKEVLKRNYFLHHSSKELENKGFIAGYNQFFRDLDATTRYKRRKNPASLAKTFWILNEIAHEVKPKSNTNEVKPKSNTIVGLMLEKKLTDSNTNTRRLLLVIAAYLIFVGVDIITFNQFVLIIPSLLLAALYLDQYLIVYRVRKGWYGRNEYEAREIIAYVISHADKDDFNDEGGLKKLMDSPEREAHTTAEVEGWTKA